MAGVEQEQALGLHRAPAPSMQKGPETLPKDWDVGGKVRQTRRVSSAERYAYSGKHPTT